MDILQTVLYVLVFIATFWLLFKSVNYFEKI